LGILAANEAPVRSILGRTAIVVGALVLSGCGSRSVANLAPRDLVTTYYMSLEQGDKGTARACLAPSLALLEERAPDSDFNNIQSIRNVSLGQDEKAGAVGTSFSSYFDLREIAVEFDVTYKTVVTAYSGHRVAFVLVGKETKDAPWKIVSIGSGP
jgi:hypothetical protein